MTQEEKKEKKRLYDIEYRKKNAEKISKKRKENYSNLSGEEKKERNKKNYLKLNKENKKKTDSEYAKINKEKLNQKKKEWALANKEKVKKAKTKHYLNKIKNDPLFKLKHNVACSIRQAFKRKGFTKNSKSNIILGCDFLVFKEHIESLWQPWMNWNNYGKPKDGIYEPNKTWDIDHITPISSAKTEDDVIRLNHYTNLQPLCSYTNQLIKKNNLM